MPQRATISSKMSVAFQRPSKLEAEHEAGVSLTQEAKVAQVVVARGVRRRRRSGRHEMLAQLSAIRHRILEQLSRRSFGHCGHSGSRSCQGNTAFRVASTTRSTGSAGSNGPVPTFGERPSVMRCGPGRPVTVLDVLAPLLWHGRLREYGILGRDCEQVGPDAWHDVHDLVATAAGGDPSPARVAMGELVYGFVRHPLAVDRQREMGERVKEVAVAAVLADENLRRPRFNERRDDGVEGSQPGVVARPRRERDVDRAAFRAASADVVGEPGLRKQGPAGLVQADREHLRVVPERRLDAVAVVNVHVDVRDLVDARARSQAIASAGSL